MKTGIHFLQIPGPTNIPDRVRRAISEPLIDHRGRQFSRLAHEVLERLRLLVKTEAPIMIFPGSGTGGWEAALVNTLSPGDRVIAYETGHFATLWSHLAGKLGLIVEILPGDWRHGIDAEAIEDILSRDKDHEVKAVLAIHNETSTGVTSSILDVREALDRAGHPALLIVDAISSLGSMDYRHDEWGIDVTVVASQKGLMLPPGLAFNIAGPRALHAARSAGLSRSYWDWEPYLEANRSGFFPYTPVTNLLFGLQESLAMLLEEGIENVFARHYRHAEAARRTVRNWGLEILCLNPSEYSNSVTGVLLAEEYDASRFHQVVEERFNMSLGAGLGKLAGTVLRIGHLGDFNDLMLVATLAGVQMGLRHAGVSVKEGGLASAMEYLAEETVGVPRAG